MSRPYMTPAEVQAVRSFKGWTQTDLATYLGHSKRTIGNYESGFTKVPRGVQFRLDPILAKVNAQAQQLAAQD